MNPLDGFRFGATLDGPLAAAETPADNAPPDAPSILIAAADCIGNRAAERDHANGERSMVRAVAMFNAWRSGAVGPLTETDGWVYMALLKLARAAGGRHKLDDYIDGAAYIALAGESAEAASRFGAPQK